jgi:hypothetical protein
VAAYASQHTSQETLSCSLIIDTLSWCSILRVREQSLTFWLALKSTLALEKAERAFSA